MDQPGFAYPALMSFKCMCVKFSKLLEWMYLYSVNVSRFVI